MSRPLFEVLRWLAQASVRAALNTGQELHLWQARAFAHALRLVLDDAQRRGEVEAGELDDGTDALVAALHPKMLAARRLQIARQFPARFDGEAGEGLHHAVAARAVGDGQEPGCPADGRDDARSGVAQGGSFV